MESRGLFHINFSSLTICSIQVLYRLKKLTSISDQRLPWLISLGDASPFPNNSWTPFKFPCLVNRNTGESGLLKVYVRICNVHPDASFKHWIVQAWFKSLA